MATYYNTNKTLMVSVDNRMQGWGVSVDVWDDIEESWTLAYDSYMISESLREAVTDALCSAGFDWWDADALTESWGIVCTCGDCTDD